MARSGDSHHRWNQQSRAQVLACRGLSDTLASGKGDESKVWNRPTMIYRPRGLSTCCAPPNGFRIDDHGKKMRPAQGLANKEIASRIGAVGRLLVPLFGDTAPVFTSARSYGNAAVSRRRYSGIGEGRRRNAGRRFDAWLTSRGGIATDPHLSRTCRPLAPAPPDGILRAIRVSPGRR